MWLIQEVAYSPHRPAVKSLTYVFEERGSRRLTGCEHEVELTVFE